MPGHQLYVKKYGGNMVNEITGSGAQVIDVPSSTSFGQVIVNHWVLEGMSSQVPTLPSFADGDCHAS